MTFQLQLWLSLWLVVSFAYSVYMNESSDAFHRNTQIAFLVRFWSIHSSSLASNVAALELEHDERAFEEREALKCRKSGEKR